MLTLLTILPLLLFMQIDSLVKDYLQNDFSLKLAYNTSYMMLTLLALYHQNKTKSFLGPKQKNGWIVYDLM